MRKERTYILLVILLWLLLKLPSLAVPHREGDEIIYTSLARNLVASGRYSLQGTAILPHLSQAIYDRPFFHHPPLYVLMAVPFVWLRDGQLAHFAVIISWLGHLLCVVAVYLILSHYRRDNRYWGVIFPAAAMALDPLLIFTSQKIWLDSLLAGLVSLAVALFLLGLEDGRWARLWLASGAAWGFAILTKLPAAICLLVPAFALALDWASRRKNRMPRPRRLPAVLLIAIPASFISAPWFVKFYSYYGKLFAPWIPPDPWAIANNPFLAMVTFRPFHYYFSELLLLNPFFLLVCLLLAAKTRKVIAAQGIMIFWFLSVMIAFTVLGAAGWTFQTRFITMAMPPLYVLLGLGMPDASARRSRLWGGLCVLVLVWNVATGLYFVLHYQYAELFSPLEMVLQL